MAAPTLTCANCGAENKRTLERCEACGAKLDLFLESDDTQVQSFQLRYGLIAFGIIAVLSAIAFYLLPMFVPVYDPQGLPGLMLFIVIAFVGSAITARFSPMRTYFEPAVGAALSAPFVLYYLVSMTDVKHFSEISLIASGCLAVMVTVLGAIFGEKLQGPVQKKPAHKRLER